MPALLTAAALLWAPGAALLAALGAGRWWWVLAPGVTAGVVGVCTAVQWATGLAWAWPAGALAAGTVLAVARPREHRRERSPAPARARAPMAPAGAVAAAGVVAAAAVLGAVLAAGGLVWSAPNQLWDAAWHANLTTWVGATGDGAPPTAGELLGAGWREVDAAYPTGLHVLAALVAAGSGAGVVPSLHAVVVLSAVVVLPAVLAALVLELRAPDAGRATGLGAAAAAVVGVLPTAFPLDHLWRPFWPTTVGFVLGLLAAVALLRCHRAVADGALSRPCAAAVAGSCLVGTAAVHPTGVILAGLVVGARVLGHVLAGAGRRARWRPLAVVAAVGVAALAAAEAASRRVPALASLFAHDNRTASSGAEALTRVLGLTVPVAPEAGYGVPDDGPQVALALVLLAALAVVLTTRGARWLGALWVLLVLAAADTAAPVAEPLRLLTGFFYNSQARTVALVALVGAVMTGVAVAQVAPAAASRRWTAGTASVLAAAVLAGAALDTAGRARPRLHAAYTDRVVGPDQQAVMRRVAADLPEGGRVLGDPVDGSAWLYALTGALPVFPHYNAHGPTGDGALVLQRLNALDTDPAVRAALERLRVCSVYVGGGVVSARREPSPGFTGLDSVAGLALVDQAGRARAYRVVPPVTGCST